VLTEACAACSTALRRRHGVHRCGADQSAFAGPVRRRQRPLGRAVLRPIGDPLRELAVERVRRVRPQFDVRACTSRARAAARAGGG
jgi:hypothetical protein